MAVCFLTVICRIGSLENDGDGTRRQAAVICRIGSLEIKIQVANIAQSVICRIGSLEMLLKFREFRLPGYLPHRQFRKSEMQIILDGICYLPHRQFRKPWLFG